MKATLIYGGIALGAFALIGTYLFGADQTLQLLEGLIEIIR